MSTDIIDTLAGIAPGSPLDALRRQRVQARDNAEASYIALFAPADPGTVPPAERFALAFFVAGLTGVKPAAAHYRTALDRLDAGLGTATAREIARGAAEGPYGAYPAGPLSREDRPGLVFRVDETGTRALGARFAAGLEHAHLLVLRPREASSAALQALLDAGWTTEGIVTLSQIVAFVSFQARLAAGLTALAAAPAATLKEAANA